MQQAELLEILPELKAKVKNFQLYGVVSPTKEVKKMETSIMTAEEQEVLTILEAEEQEVSPELNRIVSYLFLRLR